MTPVDSPTPAGAPTLNPWFSMWVRPRATIRQIVAAGPDARIFILAAAGGVSNTLGRATAKSLGDHLALLGVLGLSLCTGAISGILMMYVTAALVGWTGRWLRGYAPREHLRAAVAWPNILTMWALLLLVPEVALFGSELFTSNTPQLDASPTLRVAWWTFASLELIIGVWTLVVFLKCLGEVQGFSAWKALGNVTLAGLSVLTPLLALLVLIHFVRS